MHYAFSPRLDNALLSHGAGTGNNIKEGERQINLLFMIYDLLFLREMFVILDRLGERYYGRCVVMLGDPRTLPYRQVRSWGWGAKQGPR